MTIIWMDTISGNDTTGDGSYANPYQSGTKSVTACSSYDELRIKATGADTNVVGDCTFTYNSTTVNTASDLTGSISSGDWIGKGGVAKANGVKEHYYRVSSINSSSITLESHYFGTTETVSSVDVMTYGSIAHQANSKALFSRSSAGSSYYLQISGGWDSETTQNGVTWLRPSDYPRNNSYYCFDYYSNWYARYHDVSKVNFVDFGKFDDNSVRTLTDSTILGYGCVKVVGGPTTFERVCDYNYTAQGYRYHNSTLTFNNTYHFGRRNGNDYWHCGSSPNFTFNNVEIYGMNSLLNSLQNNQTTGSSFFFNGVKCYNCSRVFNITVFGLSLDLDTVECYDCQYGIYSSGDNCNFANLYLEGCTNSGFYLTQSSNNVIENCNFKDCAGSNIYADQYSLNIKMVNCDFDNPGTRGFYWHPSTCGHSMSGCTVSEGDSLFYNPSGNYVGPVPPLIVSNGDGEGLYNGRYNAELVDGIHTTNKGWKITNKSTKNSYIFPIPISSLYAKEGANKTITLKYKMDSGWVTTSGFTFALWLNKQEIQVETPIMTEALDWTDLTINLDGSNVFVDGVVELVVYPNGNTNAVYIDNIEVQ